LIADDDLLVRRFGDNSRCESADADSDGGNQIFEIHLEPLCLRATGPP
jgi:hypothetical protein